MDLVSSQVLEQVEYRMPSVASYPTGVAWLRSAVPRFCDGELHLYRRRLVEEVLAVAADRVVPHRDPTVALLRALDLPIEYAPAVATIAESYQPDRQVSAEADAAVEQFVADYGARDDMCAATLCVLVQAHAATRALIEAQRCGRVDAPVSTTRRVGPDGVTVMVDLSDAHFGRGPHECPARELALRLAAYAQ